MKKHDCWVRERGFGQEKVIRGRKRKFKNERGRRRREKKEKRGMT